MFVMANSGAQAAPRRPMRVKGKHHAQAMVRRGES
jgi:hypothetical protein